MPGLETTLIGRRFLISVGITLSILLVEQAWEGYRDECCSWLASGVTSNM